MVKMYLRGKKLEKKDYTKRKKYATIAIMTSKCNNIEIMDIF